MSESSQARFTQVETPELGEYQPLSATAVAALLASIAGIVAAFQPWLVAIPLFAAVLSAIAMVIASRPDARASGRWLATTGLLFSLFIVGFASARGYSRKQHLCDLARPHAEAWLRLLLDGRIKEAHQLTQEESMRDKGDLDMVYSVGEREAAAAMAALEGADGTAPTLDAMASAPKPRRDEIEQFKAMPYVQKLLKLTPHATLSFVGEELISDTALDTVIAQTYAVAGADGEEPFEVTLVLKRSLYGDHASWHVSMQ